MLDNFDPNSIQDPALRQAVLFLMNQVEELSVRVKSQAEEIQRLRDENNRLKGEQGKPQIKPDVEPKLISSEKERKSQQPHRKGSKLQKIVVNRHHLDRYFKNQSLW
jgi:regulator of replication initiation timing